MTVVVARDSNFAAHPGSYSQPVWRSLAPQASLLHMGSNLLCDGGWIHKGGGAVIAAGR